MPKYKVSLPTLGYETYIVEAENKDTAIDVATNLADSEGIIIDDGVEIEVVDAD